MDKMPTYAQLQYFLEPLHDLLWKTGNLYKDRNDPARRRVRLRFRLDEAQYDFDMEIADLSYSLSNGKARAGGSFYVMDHGTFSPVAEEDYAARRGTEGAGMALDLGDIEWTEWSNRR